MELVATGALNRQTHEQLAPIISSISSLVYIFDTIKKVGYSNSLNDLAAGIIKVTPREVIKKWSTVQGIFDKNPMSLKD